MPKPALSEPFMHQLRRWRESKKISQFDLAIKLQVHPSTMWRWEHGHMLPSQLAIFRLNQIGFYPKEEVE